MLKGDYCLESDIDKHASKKRKPDESRFSFPSELFDMLFNKSPSIGSESRNKFILLYYYISSPKENINWNYFYLQRKH